MHYCINSEGSIIDDSISNALLPHDLCHKLASFSPQDFYPNYQWIKTTVLRIKLPSSDDDLVSYREKLFGRINSMLELCQRDHPQVNNQSNRFFTADNNSTDHGFRSILADLRKTF